MKWGKNICPKNDWVKRESSNFFVSKAVETRLSSHFPASETFKLYLPAASLDTKNITQLWVKANLISKSVGTSCSVTCWRPCHSVNFVLQIYWQRPVVRHTHVPLLFLCSWSTRKRGSTYANRQKDWYAYWREIYLFFSLSLSNTRKARSNYSVCS